MDIVRDIEELIEEVDLWFEQEIRRGAIARYVDAYNQAHAARTSLRDRIRRKCLGAGPAGRPPIATRGDLTIAIETPGAEPPKKGSKKP